jgi:glycosyltransferase involved in cell wall biosynthesis
LVNQIARFHEVWVITNAGDRAIIEEALKDNPFPNIHFEYVALPRLLRHFLRFQGSHQFFYYLWQIRSFWTARRLNQTHRFDLFHHITYANDWMVSFVGALLPIPYVRGPGGGAHRTPKLLQKEYSFSGRIWEKFRSIGQWLFRRDPFFMIGQNRASAILLCNQDSVASLPPKWAHKVHLFPVSGVSAQDLSIATVTKTEPHTFDVLSAGTLIRIKGFALAIKAFSEFSRSHPDAQLSIVGSGPEETRLRDLIRNLEMTDKVQLVGAVSRDELLQKMASCDVFLFPSLRDGGGTVVIEAMAVGKPVVCLDIGGPGMHITDECGIKIDPASPEATVHKLAEALERLYSDSELCHVLGSAGRKKAERTYQWSKLGDRLNQIYGEALNASRDK